MVPEIEPARKIVVATPFNVSTSAGVKVPNVVEKTTCVPLCTGVPADSMTIARTVARPFSGKVVWSIETEIVELVGAVSGRLSQAITPPTVTTAIAHKRAKSMYWEMADDARDGECEGCTERLDKDNRLMELAGQGNRGYAMAALLVGMSVMAVLMSALVARVVAHGHSAKKKKS